jgi:hypothetical protein
MRASAPCARRCFSRRAPARRAPAPPPAPRSRSPSPSFIVPLFGHRPRSASLDLLNRALREAFLVQTPDLRESHPPIGAADALRVRAAGDRACSSCRARTPAARHRGACPCRSTRTLSSPRSVSSPPRSSVVGTTRRSPRARAREAPRAAPSPPAAAAAPRRPELRLEAAEPAVALRSRPSPSSIWRCLSTCRPTGASPSSRIRFRSRATSPFTTPRASGSPRSPR